MLLFIRACERLFPPGLLSLLLWPPAAIFDLLHARERQPFVHWRRLPAIWRPKRWRFVLRQSLGLYHSQLFYMWPDRLADKRWRDRCRFEGRENLRVSEEAGKGIVFACLHFGPFEILPYWLRAKGIITQTVRTRPPEALKGLTDYQYFTHSAAGTTGLRLRG